MSNDEDLAHAEREAAKLLAELEANDAAEGKNKYQLPSPYAPGEGPDPVGHVARPTAEEVAENMFRPVDPNQMQHSTLPDAGVGDPHKIDWTQKIREARNPYGRH